MVFTVFQNNMKIFELVAPFFLTMLLLIGRKCTVVMSNHFLFVKFNSHWWYSVVFLSFLICEKYKRNYANVITDHSKLHVVLGERDRTKCSL